MANCCGQIYIEAVRISHKTVLFTVMLLTGLHLLLPPLLRGDILEVEESPAITRGGKVALFNTVAVGGILTYGTLKWRYWEKTPHYQSEGWFGRNTKHGGADKTGHMYTAYVFSRAASRIFESWGYENDDSATLGTISSLLVTSAMEVGDSFSSFGFSPEDFYSNIIGASLGYLLVKYPKAGEFVDYRVEYSPSSRSKSDITTDYQHLKYLLAFRFAGFDELKSSPFRYVDLLAGYYARYPQNQPRSAGKERHLFIGVGLDLSEMFSFTRVSEIFRYLEIPYTYLSDSKRF
jgi:hypothetical protein